MAKQSLQARLWVNTAVVLAFLFIVGAAGVYALWSNIQGFNHYRDYGALKQQANDLLQTTITARLNITAYLRTNDDATAVKSIETVKGIQTIIDAISKDKVLGSLKDKVAEADKQQDLYASTLDKVRGATQDYVKSQSTLWATGPKLSDAMNALLAKAKESQDIEYLNAAAATRAQMMAMRVACLRFMVETAPEYKETTLKAFSALADLCTSIEPFTGKYSQADFLKALRDQVAIYHDQFVIMADAGLLRKDLVDKTLVPAGAKLMEIANAVKDSAVESQKTVTMALERQNTTLFTVIIGVLVLSVAAATILSGILAGSIVRSIQTVIEGLGSSSQSVGAAASEIAASSQALAEASSEQAATVEETSASMEEISSMVKTNTQSVEQVSTRATQANDASRQGLAKMKDLEGKLKLIRDAGNALKGAMAQISKSSKEVAVVASTIDEIAFQTNLLSLNAAVEAARAGEAGAGFAVVAGEVGQLAQRSASNATQTTQLIGQAAESSKAGVTASDEVIKSLNEATKLFDEVTKLFNEIATQVAEVSTHTEEVKQASTQQTSGIEQINTAVSQLDQVIQQNAATSEEAAGAASQLSTQADQLRRYVEQLKEEVYGSKGLTSFEAPPSEGGSTPQMFPGRAERPHVHAGQNVTLRGGSSRAALIDKSQIVKAISAHGEWKGKLKTAIATGHSEANPDKVATDNQCAFGKWFYSLPAHERESMQGASVRELHARFHKEAAGILQKALSGDKQGATDAMGAGSSFDDTSQKLVGALQDWNKVLGKAKAPQNAWN